MDLDALLLHYFGTVDLDDLGDAQIDAGREKLRIAFGTEAEPGRRFAIWVILHGIGDPPDPEKAFKDPRERAAAQAYARGMERAERDAGPED